MRFILRLFAASLAVFSYPLAGDDGYEEDPNQQQVCIYCGASAGMCDCEEYHQECRTHYTSRGCGRPQACDPDARYAYDHGCCGTWLPEDPPLFRPFAADPRQLTYSVGWRFNDSAMPKNTIPISFWDTIPFYRWFNIGPWCGQLQVELNGGLWAIFDPCTYSAPLINADYYVGLALSYAYCDWSFRLRFYHISSHIGDEYLLNNPDFDRRNPSWETIDFYASLCLTHEIRLYGGGGFIVSQDSSHKKSRVFIETGSEVRIARLGCCDPCSMVCGHPYYAMNFRWAPHFEKHIDQTYVLGYEFTKCCGLRRRLRFFMEYHDGYSFEGQFCRKETTYFSLRSSYGY